MKKTPNLSTSNSNNHKKAFLKIIIFIAIFLIINFQIGLKLEEVADKKDIYATVKWKEFYEMPQNSIDLVFIGSSYAYRSFDPDIFDKELNVNSFNMGSPLQKPVESYYILKETLKHQKPSLVVYDMNWGVFNEDKYFNTKLWNFDNMKFSPNKIRYLINVFDDDQYIPAVSKSARYHDDMNKLIKSLFNNSVPVSNQEHINSYLQKYKGKGFIINNDIVTLESINDKFKNSKKNPRSYKWDERQLKYFYKIIELCKKEDIKIVLVTAPVAPSYLKNYSTYWYDYDEIHETAKNIAEELKLEYFDYNTINKDESIVTDIDFSDTNHLNYAGAQKISLDLANRLKTKKVNFN